jgi:hypothetical protein
MNNDIEPNEEYEYYGDIPCVDQWMTSENNGYYTKNLKYTMYLEDRNTLVIGITYLNNPTKFIPNSIIKLKRL